MGAEKSTEGDCSYTLKFMDNLLCKVYFWEGDDEFPPSSQFFSPIILQLVLQQKI